MKRINMALGLLALLGLTSCNQNPTNMKDEQVYKDKEVFTLYDKTDSIVHTARVLTTDNINFDLLQYDIDISTPEDAKQKNISIEHLDQQKLDSAKTELQKTYNWTPFKGNNVLFIQIQPKGFKTETELLDKRQDIEDKLNSALDSKKLGEWFAGDIGPGGGNILFVITDVERALQTIMMVLKQNNLDKNVLIGRRVRTNNADWFYEVIYPTNYSGDFNTM
jgi:hypothetical protein